MASDQKTVSLGEICSIIKRGISPKYTEDDGILVYNQRCIRDNRVSTEQARKNDVNIKKIPQDRFLKFGDILINSTGVGTLGRVAQVKNLTEQATIDSHVTLVRLEDNSVDAIFFGWSIINLQPVIEALGEGSTGQTELSRHRVAELNIVIPPLNEQKAIAHVLGSLDDKIELNRRMNETLEGMAQALFKSWFVDFDPVIDNALIAGHEIPEPLRERAETRRKAIDEGKANREVAKEFPDKFQLDEDLGWIPEGWEVKNLGGLLKSVSETYPLSSVERIIFLNTGDILKGKFLHSTFSKTTGLPGQAKKSVNKEDILYSEIRPINCRFAYVYFDSSEYVVSTKLMVLRSTSNVSTLFIYNILKDKSNIEHLQFIAESRSGTFPQITFEALSEIKIALPCHLKIINHYTESFNNPIFEKQLQNDKESEALTKLRDTLLPKLISGELRIPDAEKMVEEALS